MKAVILAAGMGTRLRPMTENMPKCLIEVKEKTLLEYSLENLAANGIKEVIIVTGYLEYAIKDKVGENHKGINIRYVRNDRFSETGSMYSLSCAKDIIDEDILLLESDLLYEKKAVTGLLESELTDAILVSNLLNNGDDVYICTAKDNRVTHIGKKISPEQTKTVNGCLVGISKLSYRFLSRLFDTAEMNYKDGIINNHYEECILETALNGAAVYALKCEDLIWTEIDNENDLRHAKEVILPKILML